MPVNVETMRVEFPEFNSAGASLVSAKLADAATQLDEDTLGKHYEPALKQMTAHLIAMSPGGEFARLAPKDAAVDGAATVYERNLNRILACVPSAMVV